MYAVYSSTNDSLYSFFIPITAWCWHKLGIRGLVFVPLYRNKSTYFALETAKDWITFLPFEAPEHKQATFAQMARLFAASVNLPEDTILCTTDCDMLLFQVPPYYGGFTIFGSDLVPGNQIPICYISAKIRDWRSAFNMYYGALKQMPNAEAELKVKSYQQCLDETVGLIECDHFRGNQWSLDQNTAFNKIINRDGNYFVTRSNGENQFSTKRIDRDDTYFMDRLNPDIYDYHCHRPGYLDENFEKIISVIKYFYPNDDLTWMQEYQQKYKSLL